MKEERRKETGESTLEIRQKIGEELLEKDTLRGESKEIEEIRKKEERRKKK